VKLFSAIVLAGVVLGRATYGADAGGPISSAEAQRHIIVIKGGGEPMRPEISFRQTASGGWDYRARLLSFPKPKERETDAYNIYVDKIIEGIRASGRKKLLFFIHGGMNFPSGAAAHAAELLANDRPGSDFDLSSQGYPIFICWESPPTGYAEQVTWVRAGRSERYGESIGHRGYALVTFPFHILADIGRGLTRFPAQLSEFVHNDVYSIKPEWFSEFKTLGREIAYLRRDTQNAKGQFRNESHIRVSKMPDLPKTPARFFENVQTAAVFPFRTLSLPLLDAVGVGAWQNMLRHTDTMFDRTDTTSYEHPTPVEEVVERDQTGAIAIFFARLQAQTDARSFKITMVTHSMGAIISNRIISSYPELNYTNMVYMAAACSVRDFQASIIPCLKRCPKARFFGLSLHPLCETGEVALSPRHIKLDIAPRGSLLTWIDNIFGHPPSEEQRRFGIFQTAVLASHNIPLELRSRVSLKCFPFGGVEPREGVVWYPQHHADFSSAPFWDSSFWDVDGQAPAPARIVARSRSR